MKNAIKTLITAILAAAIAITGIFVDTTTVTATTIKGGEFQNGGTVTIKPDDELKLTVTDTKKEFEYSELTDYDIVHKYKWSSSDTSVLKVGTDLYNETDWTECIVLIGVSSGTATVTGTCGGIHRDITMTVTVTLPKATAKQKKCKHKYKVTKKATCERAGIKTCTKCKFQKAIKKLEHEYVNKTKTVIEYDYFIEVYRCKGCNCTEPHELVSNGYVTAEYCPNRCDFQTSVIIDKYGNETEYGEYPTRKDAIGAITEHGFELGAELGINKGHGDFVARQDPEPYGEGHCVEKTVQKCKYCGKEKK